MRKYIRKKKASVVRHLELGMTYRKLALTIVVGSSVGLIPVVGLTVLICFLIAYILRLNHIIIQAVQLVVFPVQLILLVPFFRIGHYLFGYGEEFFTRENIKNMFVNAFSETSGNFFINTVHATIAWFIIAIIPSTLMYFVLCYIFKRLKIDKGI